MQGSEDFGILAFLCPRVPAVDVKGERLWQTNMTPSWLAPATMGW